MDAVRALVQPVTRNLPQPVREAGVSLVGAGCYRALVEEVDPLADGGECARLAASKALGLGIVGASAVVKLPQLAKLVAARSAAGVSLAAYALEMAAQAIGLAYGWRRAFPFSTYGETALILAQNLAIAVLVLVYRGRPSAAPVLVACAAAALASLLSPALVAMPSLAYLQAAAGVLAAASKLPQIWTVYREGGTGQLSAFAVFNYLAGTLSRIFTTLQEVDDKLVLSGFVASFVFNAVLAAQMVYYWNAPSEKARGKRKATAPPRSPRDPTAESSALPDNARSTRGPSTRRRG